MSCHRTRTININQFRSDGEVMVDWSGSDKSREPKVPLAVSVLCPRISPVLEIEIEIDTAAFGQHTSRSTQRLYKIRSSLRENHRSNSYVSSLHVAIPVLTDLRLAHHVASGLGINFGSARHSTLDPFLSCFYCLFLFDALPLPLPL